ncbi:MAG TPA: SIS domain-containing protein [Verrucomicrobiales bacterium]|nr:SIS domain-containing protein [Verrucomicrobiales bacterium]
MRSRESEAESGASLELTAEYLGRVLEGVSACLETLRGQAAALAAAAEITAEALALRGKVLACGNGGSAADSSHFTTELLCRLKCDRVPFAAVSLAADAGFLTATANDYGYDAVFSRQVAGLGRAGDVLVVFSTSGNSPNVRLALEQAARDGLRTVAFLGRDGGRCRGLAEVEMIVDNPSTARIQEAHKVLMHCLCSLVEHRLLGMDLQY